MFTKQGGEWMQERIKALRKALKLTQAKFAEQLGVKPNTISQYESGRNEPIDAVVSLICREFNVSETWLRTGEGEMYVQRSREDELVEFMNQLLRSESGDIRRRFVSAISRLSTKELKILEKAALSLIQKTAQLIPPSQPSPPLPNRTMKRRPAPRRRNTTVRFLKRRNGRQTGHLSPNLLGAVKNGIN